MAISFEIPAPLLEQKAMVEFVAQTSIRPHSRYLDEHEHTLPTEFINMIWPVLRDEQKASLEKTLKRTEESGEKPKEKRTSTRYLRTLLLVEQLSWGDAGIYLCLPNPQLAGSAIEAVGTPEAKRTLFTAFY